MFREYFKNIGNEMIKACVPVKPKPKKKAAAGKGSKKSTVPADKSPDKTYDAERMRELVSVMVPLHFKVDSVKITDAGGFVPDNVDYVAYREHFSDMNLMMKAIPSELVYGAFFVNTGLTAVTLAETLGRVANLKKIDRFSDQQGSNRFIPAFILAMDMNMAYQDLKNLILDYYVSRSLDNFFEFDIMAIVNKGIVVKDWREKRSFKILDTGEDTMNWFFVLVNEYLDTEREEGLDLRKYIKVNTQYREF